MMLSGLSDCLPQEIIKEDCYEANRDSPQQELMDYALDLLFHTRVPSLYKDDLGQSSLNQHMHLQDT